MPDALDAFLDAPEVEERDALDAFLDEPIDDREWTSGYGVVGPSIKEQARNAFANFASGAGQGTADAGAALLKVGKDIDDLTGGKLSGVIEEATGIQPVELNQAMIAYLQERSRKIPEEQRVDPALAGTLPAQFGQGLGSIVPALASGYAAPVTIGGMMAEQGRKDAEAHGASEDEQDQAFYLNAAVGAVSEALLGVPALLRSARAHGVSPETFQQLVKAATVQAAKSAGREGTQEGIEQTASNIVANSLVGYDPERGTFEGVPESVFIGALVGAPVGAAVQVGQPRDRTNPASPIQQRDNPESRAGGPRLLLTAQELESLQSVPDLPLGPDSLPEEYQQQAPLPRLDPSLSEGMRNYISDPDARYRGEAPRQGFVRLYHGAAKEAGQAGRDFTPIRDYAQGYADKSTEGAVWYVDVPEGSVKTHDEYGVPLSRVIVPDEIADQAKPLRQTVSQAVVEPSELDFINAEIARMRATSATAQRPLASRQPGKELLQPRTETAQPDVIDEAAERQAREEAQRQATLLEEMRSRNREREEAALAYRKRPAITRQAEPTLSRDETYERELEEDADQWQEEHGDELLDAIMRSGGMPAKSSPFYSAEMETLHEEARDPNRHERIQYNRLFSSTASDMDDLATRLRDRGFDFQTGDDVKQAVQRRIRTGKPVYGLQEATFKRQAAREAIPASSESFRGPFPLPTRAALQSAVERTPLTEVPRPLESQIAARPQPQFEPNDTAFKRQEADYVSPGDLLSNQTEDFRLVGERGVDNEARQREAEQRERDRAQAERIQDEQQGTLFQRGSVDPNTGRRYSLSDATRQSFVPSQDKSADLALSAIAGKIERDPAHAGVGRPVLARVEPGRAAHRSDRIPLRAAQLLARRRGIEVVFFQSDRPIKVNGAHLGKRLLVNVDSIVDPVHVLAGHEVWHDIQRSDPQLAKAVKSTLQIDREKYGYYRGALERKGYERHEFTDEFMADLVGEAMLDPVRLHDAIGSSLAKRVLVRLQQWVNQALQFLRLRAQQGPQFESASAAVRNLEEARDRIVTALRESPQALREWRSVGSGPANAARVRDANPRQQTPAARASDSRDRLPSQEQRQLPEDQVQSQSEPNEPSFKRQDTPTGENVSGLKEWLKRVVMPPKQEGLPVVDYDTKNPLPDFHEYAKSKLIFGQGWGAETIPILGKAYGGRFNARDPITKAIATWHGEIGVGRALASALGVELGGTINTPFRVSKQGDVDVQPTREGQSKKIGDVFEALRKDANAYKLTPEQRSAFDKLKPLLDRMTQLKREHGLIGQPSDFFGEDHEDAYFPRIVTKEPKRGNQKEGDRPSGGGARIGAKQFFQKERAFRTEAEGWKRGYQYETDIEARLVKSIERMYKAFADKRLAADPELGARTRKGLIAELLDSYSEEILEGRMEADAVVRMADSAEARGRVHQPAFAKKIFDPEVAKTLNKAFPSGPIANAVVKTNNFVKAIALGFDLGVSRIQGITLLLSSAIHPTHAKIWAHAELKSLQALVDKRTLSKYARQNQAVIRELAQHGSSVGELQEMLAGLGSGQLIEKIPVVGTLGKAFGRNFSTFLDVAKVELYKSWREVAKPEELPEVAQAIEAMVGGARMESIGLSRKRILAERALFLAPSYYRGAVNLVGGLAESGTSGKIARHALGGYLVGGSILFYGVAKSLDMDDEEILRRLNPMDRQFMKWRVRMQGGKEVNLGIGGIFRSVIRLFGQISTTILEHPENFLSGTSGKNPVTSWLRSHSSPVVGFAWDIGTGEDFLGRPADLTRSFEPLLPMFIRPALTKVEKVPGTPLEYGASFFGISGYGMTPEDQVKRLASEFKRGIGIPPKARGTYQESEYRNLEWALRNNDKKAIRREHALLVKNMEGAPHKDPARKRIFDHFKKRGEYRFTGSDERERKFLARLTPEQKQLYYIARRENQALKSRLTQALSSQ